MRFLHLSDIHLGKRLRDYDLSEDHRHALKEALRTAREKDCKAILLSGDIYDSGSPSSISFTILQDFMLDCSNEGMSLLLIPGNHDSEGKVGYLSNFIKKQGIYINSDIEISANPVRIDDTEFFLLPYVNRLAVNQIYDADTKTLEEAIKLVLSKMTLTEGYKHVLLAHQSVLPESGKLLASGSESSPIYNGSDMEIGGSDIVPASLFKDFDYVALGHIHRPMKVGENAYYPGGLLKFDRGEASYERNFQIVDLGNDHITIEKVPFKPLHDVVVMEGKFDEIKDGKDHHDDYVFFVLTDDEPIDEPMAKLKLKFPLAAGLEYKARKRKETDVTYEDVSKVSTDTLFASFYEAITGESLDEELRKIVETSLEDSKVEVDE